MIVPRERGAFLQELIVAEVLARRGEGPLARKRWPPAPRWHAPIDKAEPQAAPEAPPATPEVEPER